ncbi:hypothetical protein [Alicyclobacillus fastidiosus]|uniref:Uncharacterized protein n=1 Tax=Alicyclobacillus fastidiosus TaxID=392011 RepID=A0ABV5ACM3_9BACL|nr:hypothetical protein [Alicyclobacillus fastidiosus]WEH11296.1 hypothetical protein PYS47_08805 [Alicyclobacillus fastidiosus]
MRESLRISLLRNPEVLGPAGDQRGEKALRVEMLGAFVNPPKRGLSEISSRVDSAPQSSV